MSIRKKQPTDTSADAPKPEPDAKNAHLATDPLQNSEVESKLRHDPPPVFSATDSVARPADRETVASMPPAQIPPSPFSVAPPATTPASSFREPTPPASVPSMPEPTPSVPTTAAAPIDTYQQAPTVSASHQMPYRPPYDYSEDYFANSATQSFLHDSYYPHVYHRDWHETNYDETDRAQDYYREDSFRTEDEYWQDYYRDQEQVSRPDYGSDYPGHTTPSSTDFVAPASFLFAGAAAAEMHERSPVDEPHYNGPLSSADNADRLTVNQPESIAAFSGPDYADRLTVNRSELLPGNLADGLAADRPEEILPTSVPASGQTGQADPLVGIPDGTPAWNGPTWEQPSWNLPTRNETVPPPSLERSPSFQERSTDLPAGYTEDRLPVHQPTALRGISPRNVPIPSVGNGREENLPTSILPFSDVPTADVGETHAVPFGNYTHDPEPFLTSNIVAETDNADRLTVNRPESIAAFSGPDYADRLTVNRSELLPENPADGLAADRPTEILPTSGGVGSGLSAILQEAGIAASVDTSIDTIPAVHTPIEKLFDNRKPDGPAPDAAPSVIAPDTVLPEEAFARDSDASLSPQQIGISGTSSAIDNPLDWESLLAEAQQRMHGTVPVDSTGPEHIPQPIAEERIVNGDPKAVADAFLSDTPTASEQANRVLLDRKIDDAACENMLIEDELPLGDRTDALLSSPDEPSPEPLVPGTGPKARKAGEHLKAAGIASLGILGGIGSVAGKAAGLTGKATTAVLSKAAQEDEQLAKVDDARQLIEEGVKTAWVHSKARRNRDFLQKQFIAKNGVILRDRTSNKSQLIRADRTDADPSGVAAEHDVSRVVDAGTLGERMRSKKSLSQKKSVVKETRTDPDDQVLPERRNASSEKPSHGRHAPTGPSRKKRILPVDESDGMEQPLPNKDKKPASKRSAGRPATKRERDLAAKMNDAKSVDVPDMGILPAGALLSPVKGAGHALLFTAETAQHVGSSAIHKVISKNNEQVATLFAIKDRTEQAIKAVKTVVRAPRRIARATRSAVAFLRNIVRAIWHAMAAIGAAGWPLLLILLAFLLVIVVVLMGFLSIINENQETSEVAALVAKLDGDLEKKIHSYGGGNAAIYYCDARGTYYQENDAGELDFYDIDMRNDTCELKTVNASSVKVYTNPEDIAAYIDAKYDGEWQVGAASWKFTVDFKGKTWTVIDWQHVPEFFTKGLNKLDKTTFEYESIGMLETYFREEYPDMDEMTAYDTAVSVTAELSNIIFDQQLQGVSDDVIFEAVRTGVRKHKSDLDLSSDQLKELNYTLMEKLTTLVGDQDPTALVYDEIVDLHGYLNWWSEDYTHIDAASTGGMGSGVGSAGSSGMGGTNNASGYPNSSGYDEAELAKWDGYNEVSLYGISEAGTTSITGDGTRITNDWSDTNMAIACEGKQNALYAYWTDDYKRLHDNAETPVRITLYSPSTGKTVTAEVRDCGGWRGFNDRYEGMNLTRQWDLLPAVWLALGGTQSSGLMNVYWKVDNAAPVTGGGGGGVGAPSNKVEIENYPWAAETDKGDAIISVNRATYVRHDMIDLLGNEQTFNAILGPDNYGSYAEFLAVRDWVSSKVRYLMKPLLTEKNINGDTYTDYFLSRRDLGNPFGTYDGGKPVQWIVTTRFDPGFEDSFDPEKAFAEIKPLSGGGSVYAVRKGIVEEAGDGSVTISYKLDEQTDELMVYGNLSAINVKAGDEVEKGTHLGNLSSGKDLRIAWYEKFVVDMGGFKRKWAYCPTMFMAGFAGVVEPDQPTEYVGSGAGARDLKDCVTIVDFAHSRLGCPYVWGATGPDTFDCSGLTQWCYARAGISIPRNSEAQHSAAVASGGIIPLDESLLQPGDILWKSGHVGIYIGNNQYIHAPTTGDVVKISTGISYFTCGLRLNAS